jgi:hypothetical protein
MNITPIAYKACKEPKTQELSVFAVDTFTDGTAKNAIIFSQTARDNKGAILNPAINITDQTHFANIFMFTQKDSEGNDVPMNLDGGYSSGEKIHLLSIEPSIYAISICPSGYVGFAINGIFLCSKGKAYVREPKDAPSVHFLEQKDLGTVLVEGYYTDSNKVNHHCKLAVELFADTKLKEKIPFNYSVDADKVENYIGGMIRFDDPGIKGAAAIRFTVLPEDNTSKAK